MEGFMHDFASDIWPEERRVAFCYAFRAGKTADSCNAKDGNPFGPFWDTFDIEFAHSETYGPLHYDVHSAGVAEAWKHSYPAEKWPVLAFTGAPAAFPVQKENVHLQKYLRWNAEMIGEAEDFKKRHLSAGPFVGIHLRNGADWVRAL